MARNLLLSGGGVVSSNPSITMFRRSHIPVAFAALLLATAPACTSDPIEVDEPSPVGVYGKPLVELPSGLAVANELVVRFRAGAGQGEIDDLVATHGARLVWRGPRTGAAVVRFRDSAARGRAARGLTSDPLVDEVFAQRVAHGAGIGTSPDELRALQWNLRALSLDPRTPLDPISGVRIAVLDTGVAYESHSDALGDYELAPSLSGVNFASGYDFVNLDTHANDDQGHGTHVVGVIAASSGITPLALGVGIIPVKVLDQGNLGTELSLAEGIYFAVDAGADVINMSLAFSPSFFPSSFLQRAITYAADRGVVLVAAVGNGGVDVVTYPAAFRAVIAVGASRMKRSARRWDLPGRVDDHSDHNDRADDDADNADGDDGDGDDGDDDEEEGDDDDSADDGRTRRGPGVKELQPQRSLRVASYSNRGALVDVVAPGGDIDRDVNRDGNPDGIVAMTFVGAPGDFDYYLYAGTSQAAAEVSALAARMLQTNPALTPDELRSVLGETAAMRGRRALRVDLGRGHVVAPQAISAAAEDQESIGRQRFFASVAVTLHHRRSGRRYARAHVEIVDSNGKPARNVEVYGSFTGAAYAARRGRTRRNGTVTFVSPSLGPDGYVSAFQVEAVVIKRRGTSTVDRPRGFYRIDSCSLSSLVEFASAAGIGTSPGPVPPGRILDNPITVVMPRAAPRQIDTLGLLNFSWGLATAPMAVAVDAAWFMREFPGAEPLQVVVGGDGVGTSPIVIDPDTAFITPMPASGGACIDLQVRTLGGAGIGTSPVIPDPKGGTCNGTCQRYRSVLRELWTAYYGGVGAAPASDGSVPQVLFDHLSSTMQGYVGFGRMGDAAPVRAYGDTLDAAGIGVVPAFPAGGASGYGVEAMSN